MWHPSYAHTRNACVCTVAVCMCKDLNHIRHTSVRPCTVQKQQQQRKRKPESWTMLFNAKSPNNFKMRMSTCSWIVCGVCHCRHIYSLPSVVTVVVDVVSLHRTVSVVIAVRFIWVLIQISGMVWNTTVVHMFAKRRDFQLLSMGSWLIFFFGELFDMKQQQQQQQRQQQKN